jgi:hypothetical protein
MPPWMSVLRLYSVRRPSTNTRKGLAMFRWLRRTSPGVLVLLGTQRRWSSNGGASAEVCGRPGRHPGPSSRLRVRAEAKGERACVRAESCSARRRRPGLETPNNRIAAAGEPAAAERTGHLRQPALTVSSSMSGTAPFPPGKDRRTNSAFVRANWNWSTPDGVVGVAVAATCQWLPSVEVSRL